MPRIARAVFPDVPHHVTQRGNRKLPVFFSDDDRRIYVSLIKEACARTGTRCLAWCLMDNHIHLILTPSTEDGLRATLAEAHRRYSSMINKREGWTGYLFQGRFASYPMSDAHLLAAIRYVENNPVAAGLVKRAEDWRWSSARAHISREGDSLTDLAAFGADVGNWPTMLREGWEASEFDDEVERRLRTGRPMGGAEWIAGLERQSGRSLVASRQGRPARRAP
jgi:putative transposase